ncbi:MAG: hypothetical protein K2J39_02060 [Ruminococcus sp.]|nr:hypothetical protein [Ruminococcus sp.]
MDCPVCRMYNTSGTKYCINCGQNLEDLPEFSYGKVDKGFYHTEEEYTSGNSDFEISENTFTINDRQSQYVSEDLFISGEVNNNDDFYFSGTKENNTPVEEFDFSGTTENNVTTEEISFETETTESGEEILTSQPYAEYVNNSVPLQAQPYNDMYSGIPPQIIGYDQNGLPIYQQSQFIGYDHNGIPIYSQPINQQSQFIGYDHNGIPVYSQPIPFPQSQYMRFPQQSVYQPEKQSETDENTEKFRDFIGDVNSKSSEQKEENFFGKTSEMGDVALPDLDISGIKKREKRKKLYMTDVEVDDADKLVPNNASKFNQKYMRQASDNGSADLGEKKESGKSVKMSETKNVDSQQLNPKLQYKSCTRMGDALNQQTDNFNTQTLKKRKVTMAEADHAVEAMPKKKKYVDELDLIELPDYMKARKKQKKNNPEFPGMSEL